MWVVVVVIMNCGFFFYPLFSRFLSLPAKEMLVLFDLKYALQINGECKLLSSSSSPPQKKKRKEKVVLEL